MKAKKANKVYCVTTEQEKQRYLKEGYDIYTDTGELLEYSTQKKVSYSQYAALLKESEAIRTANSALQSENEALRLKIGALQEETENLRAANADKSETGQAEKKETRASGKKAGE